MMRSVLRLVSPLLGTTSKGRFLTVVFNNNVTRKFQYGVAPMNLCLQKNITTSSQQKYSVVAESKDLTTHVQNSGQNVVIKWSSGQQSSFHGVWLRYNCHCSMCKQQHSGQRMTDCFDPDSASLESSHIIDDKLMLKWKEEDHEGYIPLEFLSSHSYPDSSKQETLQQPKSELPRMEYEDMVGTEDGLLRWLRHINESGMCLLHNVPTDTGTVLKIAEMIAPVPYTIYGQIFYVESNDKPINVAYSNAKLGFHQDLVYYESPPGLQFLHCVKFDSCVEGGESHLVNLFSVAEQFREENPEDFDTLTRVPATFEKIHFEREDPVFMRYQRPHINLNHNKQIVNVIWAPNFEGPLSVCQDDVVPYYKAYYNFNNAIQSSAYQVDFRMQPGDLITFNNRTMAHARSSFVLNGGSRVLEGCYLNIDEFKRKVAILSHFQGDRRPLRHVGNQCWFEFESLK